jgi:PII-like signaling protein
MEIYKMLENGPAMKVTIHLNRDTGSAHGFLVDDIFAFLRHSGIEGATVLHAYAGFGAHRQAHISAAGDVAGLHLPVIIYFIDQEQKVDAILDGLLAMITDGLVEIHPTRVIKSVTSAARVIS